MNLETEENPDRAFDENEKEIRKLGEDTISIFHMRIFQALRYYFFYQKENRN